ncbi:GNAT family N-acetyltransferase [Amnibacterium endophyticum]|uniref:GNAT family N-acetyltransferase n=1 Tax=Amnibacterium endophyticum TaxID=2109337 RepID=A0ABW4LFW7_9MICO
MTGPLVLRVGAIDEPDAVRMTDEVQRWYVEVYGGPDDDPTPPADFAAPRGRFVIGEVDGAAVAMGGWTRDGDDVKLRRMYVRPAGRRRGYAGLLLGELERLAALDGARRAVLTTGLPQTAAIALYRAHGYADVPAFGFHAASSTAVHLGKPLALVGA